MAAKTVDPEIYTKPDIGNPDSDIANKISNAFAKYWNVIVWNDDIHTYEYVILALMKVLGITPEKAFDHADHIHHHGKSVVASETKEKAELYYEQLTNLELRCTIERNS